jgi:hypothetical protein
MTDSTGVAVARRSPGRGGCDRIAAFARIEKLRQ